MRFAAPGRVNLIGEHTDYSGGLVMPAAINLRTVATIAPREDGKIALRSENLPGERIFPVDELPEIRSNHWSDYPIGVLRSLWDEGVSVKGCDLSFASDLPLGAGLSSSASIEVATAYAVLALSGQAMPISAIAAACQRAENTFVGAQSGIMDPFIACAGRQDHAITLDCRTLEYCTLPIPSGVRLAIANSMVKHSNSGGEYNLRRAEVDQGLRILRASQPRIESLRDATEADLEAARGEMPDNVFRRCRHIVTENHRVRSAAAALERSDLAGFGDLMREAHRSIRDDFEASSRELDLLVEIAGHLPGCYASRMTGGGFGGCTVNLVDVSQAEAFCDALRQRYRDATGIITEIYLCRASDGAGPVP